MVNSNNWCHVSAHGSVLFYIAVHPDCTVKELAEQLCLTPRTVWGIVGDLRNASMLHVRKGARHHHYTVNLEAPLPHPIFQRFTLRQVLGNITNGALHASPSREAPILVPLLLAAAL